MTDAERIKRDAEALDPRLPMTPPQYPGAAGEEQGRD